MINDVGYNEPYIQLLSNNMGFVLMLTIYSLEMDLIHTYQIKKFILFFPVQNSIKILV